MPRFETIMSLLWAGAAGFMIGHITYGYPHSNAPLHIFAAAFALAMCARFVRKAHHAPL